MNRVNTENFMDSVTSTMEIQLTTDKTNHYLNFRRPDGMIIGLWFYQEADCQRISQLLHNLVFNERVRRSQMSTMITKQPAHKVSISALFDNARAAGEQASHFRSAPADPAIVSSSVRKGQTKSQRNTSVTAKTDTPRVHPGSMLESRETLTTLLQKMDMEPEKTSNPLETREPHVAGTVENRQQAGQHGIASGMTDVLLQALEATSKQPLSSAGFSAEIRTLLRDETFLKQLYHIYLSSHQ
jgi:hypothetical protein